MAEHARPLTSLNSETSADQSNRSKFSQSNKAADFLHVVPTSQPADNLQELLVSLLHKDKSD